MSFPEALWLFFLFVPLIFLFLWSFRAGRRDITTIGGLWRSSLLKDIFLVKWFFTTLGISIFIVSMILALAGFAGEPRQVPFQAQGRDVIFVLDLSRSMTAQDENPSRLERSVSIIHSLGEGIPNGRFGLVGFKGIGVNLFPLSEDRTGLYSLLDAANPEIISTPGTNIADGLNNALTAFPGGSLTERTIILISDGEGLQGDVTPMVKQMNALDINLLVVGVGTDAGGKIPMTDGSYLKDSRGIEVTTRISVTELGRIADLGGGKLFLSTEGNLVSQVLDEVGRGGSGKIEGYREEETETFKLFLIFALIGLIIYQGVRIIRWKNTY